MDKIPTPSLDIITIIIRHLFTRGSPETQLIKPFIRNYTKDELSSNQL